MKKSLRNFVILFSILSMSFLYGCNRKANNKRQITIGVSYQDLQNEFVVKIQHAIRAEAKKLNLKLIELDGQGKAEKQVNQVETFVSRGVNAIILNPEDEYGSAPAVDIAVRHKVPIVIVNAMVSNLNEANAYVGSPDSVAGVMEAKEIMKVLKGNGNIVLLQGPYGHSAEVERTEGIKAVIAKYPQAKIIAEQTANWDRAQAMSVMENWLASGRTINAVIAENDEMALGAVGAIQGAGKESRIAVVGIDAISDGLKAVDEGKMVATVFQNADAQGTLAVELADELIKGQKVKHLNYIPFEMVTKQNVQEFIEARNGK